jgi:AraC-like DNA-binding protein
MFVTTVSVISRAAMRGGVSYENACSLADIYCQKMDSLSNLNDIQQLQFQMLRDFCKESEKCNNSIHTPIIQEVCDYINKHSHEQISLEDLANICHLSPRRLSYKFYQEMNVSVVDYIHYIKLEEAKLLLRYSHHSISEISNYLGYTTQSYFTSKFKKHHKLTPHEYKTSILSDN